MALGTKDICLHCDPYPENKAHTSERIQQLIAPVTNFFDYLDRKLSKNHGINRVLNVVVIGTVFRILLLFNFLKEVDAQDDNEQLHNRSLVVVREAKKRGINIKNLAFFGKTTSHFSIELNGVKTYFESLPHMRIENTLPINFDDKVLFKNLLLNAGLPYPRGRSFRTVESALEYVNNELNFPVVVKPRSGSLSKHTTCNIMSESELKEAIRIAQILDKDFIVEEFIKGGVQRITVVDGTVAAACLREPPNVVGDGVHTVEELVAIKNQDPLRGVSSQKNFTLHHIRITERTHALLSKQNMDVESVPQKGQKIYLHDKVILACGADVHDTTDTIHPDNNDLFVTVSELCKSPVVGIDFIAEDISKSFKKQKSAIIEANSVPYIDMHHYPVTGTPRNVAGQILEYLETALTRSNSR